MMDEKIVTDVQLNAFIDNELGDSEKIEMLSLMDENPHLKKTIDEMKQDMEMVSRVYGNLPVESHFVEPEERKGSVSMRYVSVAASIFLIPGVISGLFISQYTINNTQPVLTMVKDFNPEISRAEKILIHVSTREKKSVNAALDKLEAIVRFSDIKKIDVKLKFIASAEGLSVLRTESPYADRIRIISEQYKNVEFLACGIAMETALLKEKKAVTLLPEVKRIPAALGEIMENIKNSWIYMKS
ncbi:hypothetical protein MNBD_GAMMA11-63 [hydrothermal vent metagenome]|uniref:Uncharacterized protein n=1 Tax=hydrothermal vent metagenome TaxID=652676 RepID=A0A3B0XF06_9ZZZZ